MYANYINIALYGLEVEGLDSGNGCTCTCIHNTSH